MNKMEKPKARWLAIFAAAIVITPLAQAGSQMGRITSLIFRASDGLVYFYLEGSASARPACAQGQVYWVIRDEKSEAGKRQIAMLLAARAQNVPIHVTGTNACERWGDGESVDSINWLTP